MAQDRQEEFGNRERHLRIVIRGATKDRFIIVDVSEGETVIIQISAPTDAFDEFLPKAQNVLDSVEWKGG